MNNTNETQGIRVLSVSPAQNKGDVSINSSIGITFTSDINPATLLKNMVILEDVNRIFRNVETLKDYSKYAVVKGKVKYADKVATFTPEKPFTLDMRYIIMVNDQIKDITGNKLASKWISSFVTEKVPSFPPVEITEPSYGCITETVPTFKWKNFCSPSYIFQVSKVNTFEELLYNEVIPGNEVEEFITHMPKMYMEEGMYFIRVKSDNSQWSNVHQIFVKPVTDAVIAEQDTPELQNLDEFLDGLLDPVEILEYYPSPDSINISLKTNVIYVKIKGKLDVDRIRFEDTFVYGESNDEEHDEYAHEEVFGTWTVVYDTYFDVTYVIFHPDALEEDPELEFKEIDTEIIFDDITGITGIYYYVNESEEAVEVEVSDRITITTLEEDTIKLFVKTEEGYMLALPDFELGEPDEELGYVFEFDVLEEKTYGFEVSMVPEPDDNAEENNGENPENPGEENSGENNGDESGNNAADEGET